MIEIFGKVASGEPNVTLRNPSFYPNGCHYNCFERADCVLSQFVKTIGTCTLYVSGQVNDPFKVVRTDPNIGTTVGIKTFPPNNLCPVTFQEITNFNFIDEDGVAHPWKTTNEGWTFVICKTGYVRFVRPTVDICMQPNYWDDPVSKNVAISSCEKYNDMLVGLETVKEAEWIRDRMRSFSGTKKDVAYWIDGVRVGSEKTNFAYSNSLTNANDLLSSDRGNLSVKSKSGKDQPCLVIVSKTDGTFEINDVECDSENVFGAVCAYKLL